MLKATSELRFPPNLNLILTPEMKEGAEIIAEEIRGNIKRGTDPSEQVSHQLNAPDYANWKVKNLGESKPLVAKFRKLIQKASYIIETRGRNNVDMRLSRVFHPNSESTIAEIGSWNHHGTKNIPARPFFLVSKIARKRVLARLSDKITRLIRGKA